MSYSVVWFKRDMRLSDHAALHAAASRGPVLCLYVIEPSLWSHADTSMQHLRFALECAQEVDEALREWGGRLHTVTGELVDVLARLHAAAPFQALHAHEETGNHPSYQRDLAVGRWCRAHGVGWHEHRQFGVVRRLASRDHWQAAWEQHMAQPLLPVPAREALRFMPLPWSEAPPDTSALRWPIDPFDAPHRQRGGRRRAMATLNAFLSERCGQYRGGISSPLRAPSACSRLSPYLAMGCLSLREVVQATRHALADPATPERHRAGLSAFLSRLYWHCHFIQKLESEPELEWRNLHRGYDGLREPEHNPAHFDALVQGRTGWPMVDACVAMLHDTGWLNFRMRAMLVSVAAYPLWLHWRPVGLWLARRFLDYEPGIHWSQMQMQSGTTGINTTRVYNPIKQAQDHDPHGHFVRRWVPALRKVPEAWRLEPWRMPPDVQQRCGVTVGPGADIPLPVVDLAVATRLAKARVHGLRAQAEVKAANPAIVHKHGSRKHPGSAAERSSSPGRKRASTPTPTATGQQQMTLAFGPPDATL